MAKLPSLQFYPGDWKKDPGIQVLTLEEKGAWFEILLAMFESEKRGVLLLNGNPLLFGDVARLLGISTEKCTKILHRLLEVGVASEDQKTGALCCRRMIRDEKLRQTRITAGKQNGSKSEAKRKQTGKQKTPPSSSSSISSSSSDKEKSPVLSPDVTPLCNYLALRIRENDPNAKLPCLWEYNKGWGKAARLLLEKDNRPPGEAGELITWATSHPFWKSNILSMGKFREKYTTLKLQRDGEKEKKQEIPQGRPLERFEPEDYSKAASPDKVREILSKSPLLRKPGKV